MQTKTKYLIRGLDYFQIARICLHELKQKKMELQTSEYGGLEVISPDDPNITFSFQESCLYLVMNSLDFCLRTGMTKDAPRRLIFGPDEVSLVYKALFTLVASRHSIFHNQWKEDLTLSEVAFGDEIYLTYENLEEEVIFSYYL